MSVDEATALAKRDAYITELSESFADTYGSWMAQQSPEKQQRIRRKATSIKHGMAVVAPLTCLGPQRCPFFAYCPIPEDHENPGPKSDYPTGKPCVLEVEYVAQRVYDYLTDLKVDHTNSVERSLVDELALLDLLRNRAVMVMSTGDSRGQGRDMLTVDESIIDFAADGTPMTNTTTKAHPAIDIMDKHERRRQKILDKFAATRESKIKLYGGNTSESSQLMKDLHLVRAVMQQIAQQGLELTGETTLEDYDERIT